MFVIVSSWENLPDQTHKEKDIATRIGLTLSKAVCCASLIHV